VPDEYRGLDRYEAREKVIAAITGEGNAVMTTDEEGNAIPLVEKNKMQQPTGDRSKVVIEPMLTDQWFCDAETLAKPALASVKEGRTNFVPKTWENTYYNWMENIQPWCISRQLWWGHQIPVWYGPKIVEHANQSINLSQASEDGRFVNTDYSVSEGKSLDYSDTVIFCARDFNDATAQAENYYQALGFLEIVEKESLRPETYEQYAEYAGKVALVRDPDVLDTWFSSALWPFSTLGWPDKTKELETYYQTDVLVTGFDIIFFWVARMMMMGNHGNVIDPLELMDKYGTDALRFTLSIMAAQGRDVRLDEDRIVGYRNFGTKLWNATRFAEMNDVKHAEDFKPEDAKLQLNRWILTELSKTIEDVSEGIEKYRFNDAAGAAYKFVWNTFCDWHLELLKPIFNGDDADAKAEAQAVAAYVLDQIYKLLHPFMPFMTEELWEKTAERGGELLCHAQWPKAVVKDQAAADEINWLIELVSEVRSVRAEMNIKPSLEMQLVIVGASDETKARLARNEAAGETTVCLPLKGLVDFDAEITRLEKELEGIDKDLKVVGGKLNNEKFVANAPDAVVQENRDRMAELDEKRGIVSEALERVKSFN